MMNCNVENYINFVKNNPEKVCKEQLLLVNLVEKAFKTEDIYVDEQQLEKYLDLQKYFPFKLLDWEKFIFTLHNCTYKQNGQPRWPILFVLVGRGAGKNGYLAFEDFCLITPVNPVKYYFIDIFATSEDQAKTSFEDIYDVLETNKVKMKKHFYWNKEVIINLRTKSRVKFRTSGAKTKDGGRPGKVDFDEFHAYEDSKLVDVAITGLGKKPQPRRTIVTTNGDIREGELDKQIYKSERILSGELPDNGTLPFVCKLDSKEEINQKDKWQKANPSYPYFEHLQSEMDIEYSDYLLDPISNSSFATKRLNWPQGQKEVEVTSWENILATNQPLPDITVKKPAVWGVDYASTTDFVAALILFKYKEIYYCDTHTWVCKNCRDLHRIKAPLKQWEERGLLTFVDDVEVNPDIVSEWLTEKKRKYNLIFGGMDKYRYTLLSKSLCNAGFNPDRKNGNFKLMKITDQMIIAPTLESLFNNHLIAWGDNPLMRWYTNNAKRMIDDKGNITYGKIEPKSRKTDGFMALVCALSAIDKLDVCSKERKKLPDVKTY